VRTKNSFHQRLLAELAEINIRLFEAEDSLRAISSGEVDALVVSTTQGEQLFTLRSADYTYRVMVEEMGEGAVTLSETGTILFCNNRFAELTAAPIERLVGYPIRAFLSPAGFASLAQAMERKTSQRQEIECELGSANQPTPVRLTLFYLPGDTPPVFGMIVVELTEIKNREMALIANRQALEDQVAERTAELQRALAEEKQTHTLLLQTIQDEKTAREEIRILNAGLEDRVEERTEELRQANMELVRTARLKDEFLASMSHELRTPLTSILGLSDVLQLKVYGDLTLKQETAVHNIEASGRHLLALINDILDISKIDSGTVQLELEPVEVQAVCQSSLQLVKVAARKKNIGLSLKIDPSVASFPADERRLKQVLVNLLSNAVKFTPEAGSVGLEVEGDRANQRVKFTVWDTGIGIAAQDVERLFKPFVQLDAALSRQYEGTGLGLAMVLKLVELHGGGIRLDSAPGQGSRFSVVLPWAQPAGRPDLAGGEPELLTQGAVLLVEENDHHADILTGQLGRRGYRVFRGHEAEDCFHLTREMRPDVILMNVPMPVQSSLQVVKRIRADEKLHAVPIIGLTALAVNGDREKCLRAGMDEYLTRPVRIDELLAVMGNLLRRRRGEAA
jgi:signal transduction histidine kinase/ActR/RegA family two-component response regulator